MKSAILAAACAISVAASAALPKVMVMVDEKALGTISTSEIEAMAIEMLGKKGVSTIDQNMVQSNLERVQKAFRGAGDNRAAAAMGREFGADVILLGEAVAKPNAAKIGDTNLRSYQAAVSMRAVRTDNAANIATASGTATAIAMDDINGSTKALKSAGEKVLSKVVPELLANYASKSGGAGSGSRNIEITVGGMDQIWKLKETRARLRSMKEAIASVSQKSYAQGAAVFAVESKLPAEELAEELVLNPPEDLKIQVVEIREGMLSLRVVEARPPEGEGAP